MYLFIYLFILQNDLNGRKRYSEESKGSENSVSSYLLRFSDRIDGMKNSYGNFFIQSQSRIDFLTRGKKPFHPIRTQLSE